MLEKLQAVEDKYRELESLISDPEVMADMTKWQAYTKEHAALTPIVTEFRRYKEVVKGIEEAKSMLGEALDHEMHAFVEGELADLMEKKERLDKKLPILLLPKDPNDEKNVIVEIRGGVGGEEAALFAGDLFRMYSRYAEKKGWKVELMDANPTEIGGFKEVTFMVTGSGAYSYLKYESGTHRVQRVMQRMRRMLYYFKRIWVCWNRVFWKGERHLRICLSTLRSQQAPTLGIFFLSYVPAHSYHFYR